MEGKIYDIVIIGGGCAGLTAAIYARRAEKSVLVLEKMPSAVRLSIHRRLKISPVL